MNRLEKQIKHLEIENFRLHEAIEAIKAFTDLHAWAAPRWKDQPEIKRLFDIAEAYRASEGETLSKVSAKHGGE